MPTQNIAQPQIISLAPCDHTTMSPTFLVIGSTGNTSHAVVETLSKLLQNGGPFSQYRILALTGNVKEEVARHLATLPRVQVVDLNWVDITAAWLRENNVIRAFVASHNQPNQFAEESAFYVSALSAHVEYVVRLSATAANVRPDCPAYYPRAHWAIESLLSSPEFEALKWTSLQSNITSQFALRSAVDVVKGYRKTGKQDTLRLMSAEDTPIGFIDSADVGVFAAHLLGEKDLNLHNKAKYVLNGPEDISGRQIVELVERHMGTQVTNVRYKDMSFVDQMAATTQDSKTIILSVKQALESAWEGKCTASTTSKEVLEIAAPKRTPTDVFGTMLGE